MERSTFQNQGGRFRWVVERGILLFLAWVLLQTWCLDGLVLPLQITGPSMAPTLLGEHRELVCGDCGFPFTCDTSRRPVSPRAICPNCGSGENDLAAQVDLAGDRVLIDRSAFVFRQPRRWEVIAFRPRSEAEKIVVKRVVGLPRETVQIHHGEVYINGKIARKNRRQQKALLLSVYQADFPPPGDLPPRWTSETSRSQWGASGHRFTHPGAAEATSQSIDWLVYRHWRRQAGPRSAVQVGPVEDVLPYNQNRPYREENVHHVVDLFLAFRIVETTGQGIFWIRAGDGRDVFRIGIDPQKMKFLVYQNEREVASREVGCSRLAGLEIDVSLVDRQFLFALNGQPSFCQPCESHCEPPPGTPEPFALGAQNLGVIVDRLRIFRDIYYTAPPSVGSCRGVQNSVSLGEEEFFVLGDNTFASEDSRTWRPDPPIPRRCIFGKPLVVCPATTIQGGGFRCQIPNFSQIRAIR
jgi:signal peptidase I